MQVTSKNMGMNLSVMFIFENEVFINVMIYFNLESKKKMVESFHRKLDDGGFLLLGHAESLMNISTSFVPTCLHTL